jgi:hypothetical protein
MPLREETERQNGTTSHFVASKNFSFVEAALRRHVVIPRARDYRYFFSRLLSG